MADLIQDNQQSHELSIIKDPFLKDSITDISINMSTMMMSKQKYWWGRVKFKNGDTAGEQMVPNCESFEKALAGIKQILNSVKDK